jgi:hypothetical protein
MLFPIRILVVVEHSSAYILQMRVWFTLLISARKGSSGETGWRGTRKEVCSSSGRSGFDSEHVTTSQPFMSVCSPCS